MRELALFAGVGGGILGGKLLGWQTVCAVEINPYCQRVLMQRQDDGILDPFPIWGDITTFDGRPWAGLVDVVTGGVPCQPWSDAGEQRGENDDRNLWPETFRIIGEVGPRSVLLENVPGILSFDYSGFIFGTLSEMGYRVCWGDVGAADVGADHARERIWIAANRPGVSVEEQEMAIARAARGEPRGAAINQSVQVRAPCWSEYQPGMVGASHGAPNWVDRSKAIGNAQYPAVVRRAWEALKS